MLKKIGNNYKRKFQKEICKKKRKQEKSVNKKETFYETPGTRGRMSVSLVFVSLSFTRIDMYERTRKTKTLLSLPRIQKALF